jgi:hypothetical protein
MGVRKGMEGRFYLHQALCSLLRSWWIESNSGLPRSAEVTSVSFKREVVIVFSIVMLELEL